MPQIQEHGEIETVVRSHAGWVHTCASRRVGNEAMAQDVTQAVFILLWRRRGSLREGMKLTGWLYRAVRYCAADALRDKRIRERHEREAAMARIRDTTSGEAGWSEVSPELEQAVDRLSERDREAVLLRFYRQMSFAEVGQSLGLGEEAARKRVQRAVEKLRGILEKKGVKGTTAGLSAVLVGNVVGQMPQGLMDKIVSTVGSGGGNSVAAGIAKGAMKMMTYAKVKVAAVLVGVVLATGGAVTVATHGVTADTAATSQHATDPLADPAGALARPAWPANGKPELVQVSCVVDAKVVEKLRRAGKPVQHECMGYEAVKIDPDLALYYLKMARQNDLAYLPDDIWYRWNQPVLVPDERVLRTVFHYSPSPVAWRGERFQLEIRQQLGSPAVYECGLAAGELMIDQPNVQITLEGNTHACDMKLRTPVAVGEGVMLLGKVGQVRAGEIWHVILYQVISATPAELANYRELRDVVAWVENGAAAEQRLVQQAALWQAKATASPAKLGEKWIRDLPGGTRVEVLAVANPADPELNPYCWWTPDGAPTVPGYRRESVYSGDEENTVAAVAWVRVSSPNGWLSRKSKDSWLWVKEDRSCEQKTGAGAFKVEGTLKSEPGQRVLVRDKPYAVVKIAGSGTSCGVEMEYTLFSDLDTRVVAVTEDGKEHDPFDTDIHSGDKDVTVKWHLEYPVALSRVKELRIKSRPLYRVKFEGLPLAPAESLPEPSGE